MEPEYLSERNDQGAKLWQRASWDVGGGVWVLPPLSKLTAGSDVDSFVMSKRFLLAASGLVTITNTTAISIAVLMPRLKTSLAWRNEWLSGAGIVVAACATVLLETHDWCGKASDHRSPMPDSARSRGADAIITPPHGVPARADMPASNTSLRLWTEDDDSSVVDLDSPRAQQDPPTHASYMSVACNSCPFRLAAMGAEAIALGMRLGSLLATQPPHTDPWLSRVSLHHLIVCTLASSSTVLLLLLSSHSRSIAADEGEGGYSIYMGRFRLVTIPSPQERDIQSARGSSSFLAIISSPSTLIGGAGAAAVTVSSLAAYASTTLLCSSGSGGASLVPPVWSAFRFCALGGVWLSVLDADFAKKMVRVSCPGLGRQMHERGMRMWRAALCVEKEAEVGAVEVEEVGAGVLELKRVMAQVCDAQAVKAHVMLSLSLCPPSDALILTVSKLVAHLLTSLRVRGRLGLAG